jgi:lipoate-protein ligase A
VGWRRLGLDAGEAGELLARSSQLLDELDDQPALRWYRATSPALVLGRGQTVMPVSAELPVITRWSGGGAVLLDDTVLSLDVLVPADHPWAAANDLTAVFVAVGERWAAALRDLGVASATVHRGPGTAQRRGNERQRLLAAICYATVGAGEVLVEGRKVVGLAQRRRRPGALVQCGLLRRWRAEPLLAAFGAEPDDAAIISAAVGLDDLVDPAPSDAAVIAAVEARFEG